MYSQTFIDWTHPRHPEDARVFQDVIALTRSNKALAGGTTAWCDVRDPARAIAYVRQRGNERVVVVVNLSPQDWKGTVALPPNQPPARRVADLLSGRSYEAQGRTLRLSLPPWAYLVGTVGK